MHIKICFLTSFLLILTSCSSFKEKIGLAHYQPNEFETVQHDPLEIPPSLHLDNPQESSIKRTPTTSEKAKSLLIATNGKKTSKATHQAEQFLLKQINAEKRDSNIRRTIAQDNTTEPTLQEKIQKTLVFWKRHEKVSIIDPNEEKKKLTIPLESEEK